MAEPLKEQVFKIIQITIANETGIKPERITKKTNFMSRHGLPYFDCINVLFTLQQELHIILPESNYCNYPTVGSLKRQIIKQLPKDRQK
jgi:acyl carrier protein